MNLKKIRKSVHLNLKLNKKIYQKEMRKLFNKKIIKLINNKIFFQEVHQYR